MAFPRSILLVLLLAACATEDQVKKLEERLAATEKKVEELEKRPASAGRTAPATPAPQGTPEEEAAADKIYEGLQADMQAGKMADAKAKMEELKTKYPNTSVTARARKIGGELEVIGKDAPASMEITKWFQGSASDVNLASDKPTLMVFWESWCPHCKREVPELEATYEKFHGKGLQIVGVTRVTKSSTDEKVAEFIKEHKITFPMAKDAGSTSAYFGVSGIPAAAVVKGGKIVWRGHPARLTDEMLQGWL